MDRTDANLNCSFGIVKVGETTDCDPVCDLEHRSKITEKWVDAL